MDVATRLLDGHALLVLVFAVVAFDAAVPFLPSGTTVSLAGVVAASGRLSLVTLVAVASAAAFTGDNLVYAAGRRAQPRMLARLEAHRWSARTYGWMRHAMRHRTAYLIVLGRYVPGVRMVVMLAAGALDCPPARFRTLDAVAATLWAATAALSGYLGGTAFAHRPLLAAAVALGVGAVVMGAVDLAGRRWCQVPDASGTARHGRSGDRRIRWSA